MGQGEEEEEEEEKTLWDKRKGRNHSPFPFGACFPPHVPDVRGGEQSWPKKLVEIEEN